MQLPPVLPDEGLLDALPPSPDTATLVGALTALPDDPESPPTTLLLELESPDEALPSADGFDFAEPVSPVVPEPPDVELPEAEPWPVPPVGVAASAEWDSTAWTNRKANAPRAKAMATLARTPLILCINLTSYAWKVVPTPLRSDRTDHTSIFNIGLVRSGDCRGTSSRHLLPEFWDQDDAAVD